ncbi:unnamed protein product, partial [Ceratitis capitata]
MVISRIESRTDKTNCTPACQFQHFRRLTLNGWGNYHTKAVGWCDVVELEEADA